MDANLAMTANSEPLVVSAGVGDFNFPKLNRRDNRMGSSTASSATPTSSTSESNTSKLCVLLLDGVDNTEADEDNKSIDSKDFAVVFLKSNFGIATGGGEMETIDASSSSWTVTCSG